MLIFVNLKRGRYTDNKRPGGTGLNEPQSLRLTQHRSGWAQLVLYWLWCGAQFVVRRALLDADKDAVSLYMYYVFCSPWKGLQRNEAMASMNSSLWASVIYFITFCLRCV